MAELNLFPESVMSKETLTLETVASKLDYFEAQVQLVHWQTPSHAEHSSLNFYDDVHDFKDEVIEKLMGYQGRKIKAFKRIPVTDGMASESIVKEVMTFCNDLVSWADGNKYQDISNLAQSLSGKAALTLYLLTQS